MNKPQNTTMTVDELYSGVTNGSIISDIALQREIVYDADKQALVIDSILAGIPLPAFYFWKNSDGVLEVLDGKQRIEAVKKFRQNDLQFNGKIWKEVGPEVQNIFNETELSVIICEGEESLKREIFRRINTLGVPLNQYEVLNGVPWRIPGRAVRLCESPDGGQYLRKQYPWKKSDSPVEVAYGPGR